MDAHLSSSFEEINHLLLKLYLLFGAVLDCSLKAKDISIDLGSKFLETTS